MVSRAFGTQDGDYRGTSIIYRFIYKYIYIYIYAQPADSFVFAVSSVVQGGLSLRTRAVSYPQRAFELGKVLSFFTRHTGSQESTTNSMSTTIQIRLLVLKWSCGFKRQYPPQFKRRLRVTSCASSQGQPSLNNTTRCEDKSMCGMEDAYFLVPLKTYVCTKALQFARKETGQVAVKTRKKHQLLKAA